MHKYVLFSLFSLDGISAATRRFWTFEINEQLRHIPVSVLIWLAGGLKYASPVAIEWQFGCRPAETTIAFCVCNALTTAFK
jgi:hypothetical protein